ncbi:GxxExxY protein [Psychroserpens sp.]|uniref:GxxExxY protein n=1 Tax=Psychroserpens sp. TaxID=2020870 RepID=UPI003C782901
MSNQITENIIGAAIEVHKTLGPGLLESAYQNCLIYELNSLGYTVSKEISLPIVYKKMKLDLDTE